MGEVDSPTGLRFGWGLVPQAAEIEERRAGNNRRLAGEIGRKVGHNCPATGHRIGPIGGNRSECDLVVAGVTVGDAVRREKAVRDDVIRRNKTQ